MSPAHLADRRPHGKRQVGAGAAAGRRGRRGDRQRRRAAALPRPAGAERAAARRARRAAGAAPPVRRRRRRRRLVGRALAEAALRDPGRHRGAARPAIVVGGTGLYFRALTQGLADMPAVPRGGPARTPRRGSTAAARRRCAKRCARSTPPPRRASPRNDRQRLIRALAVAEATGRPLSAWQAETRPALPADAWRGVVLEPPRAGLYARCDARLQPMVGPGRGGGGRRPDGAGPGPRLPAMKAVGLRELAAFARGETSRAEALAAAQTATRRYAKRQTDLVPTTRRRRGRGSARSIPRRDGLSGACLTKPPHPCASERS